MSVVLATGGLGFIGSHTCISLLEEGFDVVIVDSLINSKQETFERIKRITSNNGKKNNGKIFLKICDLRDINMLEKIFKDFYKMNMKIEYVIHFAGLKSVNESTKKPLEYWDVNLNSSLNLMKVMDLYDCRNLIFSSSATIYKSNPNGVIDESSNLGPINPYGNTKLAVETMLKDLFLSNPLKWKIVSLRYFNPVGAHHSGLVGEDPKGIPNNLFPVIMKVLNKEIEFLPIFGNDWPTNDGTCIRDYIHVMDLADSHLAALKFLIKEEPFIKNLNIGTGKGRSVLEIINIFNKINNFEIPYKFVNRRIGDTHYVVSSNDLAKKLLKWKPLRNSEDMVKDALRWNFNNSEKNTSIISKDIR